MPHPAPSAPHDLARLQVAIVHEWLTVLAGSEQVLDELLALFPQADLYALVADVPGEPPRTYRGRRVHTSFIQQLPGGANGFRRWLPLFPRAVESFDLSAYDLVISSSHCVAKGAITTPRQLHVTYCYTPVRYAWDLRDQYLDEAGYRGPARWVARTVLERLRRWDQRTAQRTDLYLTLSHHIADRIQRAYGRESTVVYPAIDLAAFTPPARDTAAPRHGFVTCGRLAPYKLTPMIIRAFAAMPDCPLTVIGDGPELAACQREAANAPHIRVLGYQPHDVLVAELRTAEAFVFAALEDFGIAPVEAQACGTPVIAYGQGGATETVVDGVTGRFFADQTEDSLRAAVRAFRSAPPLSPEACRANAERFSAGQFREGVVAAIQQAWARK